MSACSVKNCDRPHKSKGYCDPHLTRVARYGSPREHVPLRPYRENKSKRQPGDTFGELTLVEKAGAGRKWRCTCSCGRETVATADNIFSGRTTSCGDRSHRKH